MRLRVGTSGFSYPAWKGSFYPEKLPTKQMLRFYAQQLGSVEINNTFYRMPRASVLETWAAQVPEDFRFAVKASRRITHIKRLVGAVDETNYLLETLAALGDRLGVVLFQLPPNLKRDPERLERFLDLLAGRVPAAFELRHPSWADEDVAARLRARDAALCVSDTDDAPADAIPPGPLAYLRLRRADYPPAALARWAARLRACGTAEAFVYFKHEDAGAGPRFAVALREAVEAR